MRLSVLAVLLAATICACSDAAPFDLSNTAVDAPSAATDSAPKPQPLYYFEGSVDVAKASMTVAFRKSSGELAMQSTLPYGNTSGSVFFHTCGTPTFNTGTHVLSGNVQAVNLMGSSVSSFIAVIDSVSLAGVTPSSGTIATYGTVAPNSANCASSQTWSFSNPTDANFTFSGHADGALGVTEHIVNGDFTSGTGSVGCGPNPFARTGWTSTGASPVLQLSGCGWSGASGDVAVSLGYSSGSDVNTFSQTFSATTGSGTLSYWHGSHTTGSCSYKVTFGPSNSVTNVTQSPTTSVPVAASSISVPTGTTSVTFGPVVCSGPSLFNIDKVSLMAP